MLPSIAFFLSIGILVYLLVLYLKYEAKVRKSRRIENRGFDRFLKPTRPLTFACGAFLAMMLFSEEDTPTSLFCELLSGAFSYLVLMNGFNRGIAMLEEEYTQNE